MEVDIVVVIYDCGNNVSTNMKQRHSPTTSNEINVSKLFSLHFSHCNSLLCLEAWRTAILEIRMAYSKIRY
jgi:hypothetical protein